MWPMAPVLFGGLSEVPLSGASEAHRREAIAKLGMGLVGTIRGRAEISDRRRAGADMVGN
jgi:hypothetical protein